MTLFFKPGDCNCDKENTGFIIREIQLNAIHMVMKNEQPYTTLNNSAQMLLLCLGTWDMHGKEAEQPTFDAL